MLDEQVLGQFIGAHYSGPGDHVFRMERLPWYDVPSQNADREAFLAGARPDWKRKRAWFDELAAEAARGLVARRVRVLSEHLTDDELMACHYGYAYYGQHEKTRVLHRGEHGSVDVLDHDYWIMQQATGAVSILRMIYSDGGAFVGAEVVPAHQCEPYLREQELSWNIAEPFEDWWARHGELHRELAA